MAVDGGAHVLLGQDGPDLLLGRDVLPGPGLPQGLQGESGVPVHLRAGAQLPGPAGTEEVWR